MPYSTSRRLASMARIAGLEAEVPEDDGAECVLRFDSPEALERAIEKLAAP